MPWIEARGDRARLTPHRAAVWHDENRLRNSYRRHCYLLWYFETVREGGGGSDAYGRSPTRRGCGGAGSARPLKARRRADRHRCRWSPYSRQEVKRVWLAVRKGKILFWCQSPSFARRTIHFFHDDLQPAFSLRTFFGSSINLQPCSQRSTIVQSALLTLVFRFFVVHSTLASYVESRLHRMCYYVVS